MPASRAGFRCPKTGGIFEGTGPWSDIAGLDVFSAVLKTAEYLKGLDKLRD